MKGQDKAKDQVEAALRESEERFRKIFDHSNDAIFVIDPENDKILDINPKACRMLGYSRDELLSMPITAIHPNEMPELLTFSKSVFERGRGWTNELTCLTKSGTTLPSEISASAMDISGRTCLVAMVRDITERKQAQEALQKAHNELELRVEQRTAELSEANAILKKQITERKRAEEALRNALIEVEQLKNRLQAENVYLQEEIKTERNFEEIIGQSSKLKKMLRKVEQVAPIDTAVLILGETGTGKELIARAIHNLSKRKDRPLIKVNCAALPSGLIESELFGHEKGAFTGAINRKIGRFELADRGTLFLDEIGDLPQEIQVKFLRVLQEHEFERVGGTQTIKMNVRVIAATNRDLQKAVKENSFRADLFYRLNVFPVSLPCLRERKEDIPLLAQYFVNKYMIRMDKRFEKVSHETMNRLIAYSWPGNIRELENVIERAVILSKGPVLEVEDGLLPASNGPGEEEPLRTLEEIERGHIVRTLEKTRWVIDGPKGAAKILKLHSNTLRSRMQRLSIKRDHHDIS